MFEYLFSAIGPFMRHHHTIGVVIAGLISFVESLAIIGSVIPGSVTMTLVGTLIGSGVLNINATVIAVLIGAFIGDYISYWVGLHYKNNIKQFSIIQRYITWFEYGESFIQKYGMASIIIGRFFGPMRSMVPLVAGALSMRTAHFIIAAIPSIMLWAVLYLTPGIMLGAFAVELPTEMAIQFMSMSMFLITLILIIVWAIQQLCTYMHYHQKAWAQLLWQRIMQNPGWYARQFLHCNQNGSLQLLKTIYAVLLLTICVTILILMSQSEYITVLDQPWYHLMQTVYTPYGYMAMTLVSFIANKIIVIPALFITAALFYRTNPRLSIYLISMTCVTSFLIEAIKFAAITPRPYTSNIFAEYYSFPSGHMTLSSALFPFLASVLCYDSSDTQKRAIYTAVGILLILIGFSRLYIHAHWFSDILFGLAMGLSIALIASILYHRQSHSSKPKHFMTIFMGFFISTYIGYSYLHLSTHCASFSLPKPHTKILATTDWWQHADQVDMIRNNRFGHGRYPLNIQWAGNIDQIQKHLDMHGWNRHTNPANIWSRFAHLLDEPSLRILPLIPQQYHLTNTALVYSYTQANNQTTVLKLWPSNIQLQPHNLPLWVGTVYINTPLFYKPIHTPRSEYNVTQSIRDIPGLNTYTYTLNTQQIQNLPNKSLYSKWDQAILQVQFQNE